MDTTETYIKMSEKAEEIQEHEPEAGDIYRNGNGNIVILPMSKHIVGFCTYECCYLIGEDDEIWLPRQDQLQEMCILDDYGRPCTQFMGWFFDFLNDKNWKKFTSMEQLWLAFVMKEKYNKVWDGKQWTSG